MNIEFDATWNRPTANAWVSMPTEELRRRLKALAATSYLDAQRAMWQELVRRSGYEA